MKHTYKKLMMVFVMTMALGWAASTANAQLVAGWTFEEGAGTVAKDHLGYGIDLFLYGDAVYDTDVPPPLVGISTHSVVFDGNGDYGEVGSYAEPYLNPGGGPWTIMCWEKTIAFINNGTFMDKAYNYRMAQYAGQLEGFMHWGPGIGEYVTGGDLSDSDWHHVAVSYDGQFMKGYVDGIEVGSKDVGGPGDSSASTFRIARRSISWGAYFNGKIDEVAIFLEVLDQPVIENFMNYGIGYYNGPLPPWVNAEPEFATVIPTGAGIPGELEIYGAAIDNTPWPPSDPCGLTAYWEMVDGPPGGSVTFATDPNNLQNTAYFTVDVVGVYHLQIYATDGYFEATDQIEVDVKHYSYTGLQNHWAFDNDLQDTAPIASPYSINNDYLESRGALAPFYGEGVAGDAVHVGHTDFANNWCWLETSLLHDSPDLELNQAFTVEMYLNPQIDKAPTESDALKWQDLVGKWFTYTTGQETHFESWEFVLNNGYPLMNVSDKSDIILPRTYDNVRSGEPLDPYEFPRIDGWQHLAFTGDGAGNISIYIDGIKTGSGQLPNAEFVDTDAPLRIANVLINSNGGVGRPSPYVGWIDELKFYEFDQPPEYFIERARLISIQGPEPIDGEQFAKQDVVLAWAPVKGYPNETPTYDVYFARDGQPLTQIATGITDTFYDPCEVGGAPLLNFDTTYNWKVVAHHSQGTTDSAEWSFKTIPANFGGMLGSALIGHWRLDEGAGTVAHDHHNLMVAGADDQSMATAVAAVIAIGGGLVVAEGERILARLPLAIGGLMSDHSLEEVAGQLDRLLSAVRELGSTLADPFMTLSFLGLEVIPALKLTDRGLVDV
ncbi:MAG: hypothetical protein GY869_19910, partial [Planctomycetes bacterium]|nr:hypothetical protein [Planctomycetota bacterium]